ncbi:MAG: hypothetical protein RLZZ228_1138 [Actinomycetota bacterium]|jgi:hypothetical protein
MSRNASPPTSDYRQLSKDVDDAIALLRQRVRTALDPILPGDYGARSLGRALELERMTAWRVWTIARVADVAQAIQAMPGTRAWLKLIERLREREVSEEKLEALRASIDAFEQLIAKRGVDRTTMRALAAGALDSTRESAAIMEARRTAARGMAKLYGVHAKAAICAHLLAPAPGHTTVSLGVGAVFEGLGRSRPGTAWPIVRRSVAKDDGEAAYRAHIALGDESELPTVIRSVSTKGIVGRELRCATRERNVETIDLCDVPADRNGRLRACLAEYLPSIDLGSDVGIKSACLQTPVLLPTDLLIVDMMIHRAMVRNTEPAASLLGTPVVPEYLDGWHGSARLPLESVARLVASPALPARFAAADRGYREALGRVVKAQGASIDEYEIFRVIVPYPPMHSLVAFTFELNEAARRKR